VPTIRSKANRAHQRNRQQGAKSKRADRDRSRGIADRAEHEECEEEKRSRANVGENDLHGLGDAGELPDVAVGPKCDVCDDMDRDDQRNYETETLPPSGRHSLGLIYESQHQCGAVGHHDQQGIDCCERHIGSQQSQAPRHPEPHVTFVTHARPSQSRGIPTPYCRRSS
jgi:hypothetical protein